jgi:hypothetical protein
MRCFGCNSKIMRPSRLRFSDVGRVFLLQYPVRCRICLQRNYVTLFEAWKIHNDYRSSQVQA